MNEEQIAQLSRQVANAPVPDEARFRLARARQAAVARSENRVNSLGTVAGLVFNYPKMTLASLALLTVLGLAMCQQRQVASSIDVALISSDVPMDALLDPAFLAGAER